GGAEWVRGLSHRPPGPTARSCPESRPVLGFDLAELFGDDAIDPDRLFMQGPQLAERLHPGFVLTAGGAQFVGQRLRHQSPQRDTSLSGSRLGAAEKRVGNFERGLHLLRWSHIYGTCGAALIRAARVS